MVLLACYCSVHLGYLHMNMTIVQLASPAIHNKVNSNIFEKGMKMNG